MKLTVHEVMTTPVVSVRANAQIDEAFSLMLRHHVSGLPVVDDENVLIGVISELDLLRLLDAPDPERNLISDYASSQVVSVSPDEALTDLVELFIAKRFRRLPVVDDQNRLIGVVSRRDLIRFIRDVRSRVGQELERRKLATALPS